MAEHRLVLVDPQRREDGDLGKAEHGEDPQAK